MSETVGIAELRQNLSVYLRRVGAGERLVVTDRNRPVALLGPVSGGSDDIDRMIAEGQVSPPKRSGLPKPVKMTGDLTPSARRWPKSATIVDPWPSCTATPRRW